MDDLVALASARPSTRWAGQPLVLLEETGSTNDEARAAAAAGAPHGYAVVADAQRQGRGRHGRVWHSPAGQNIYLSLVVRPALPAARSPLLAFAAALAVTDAVRAHVPGAEVTIKWPNDVRIDRRKIAGILVEGIVRGSTLAYAVIGIGVNVEGTDLPAELEPIATTLRRAGGNAVTRSAVLRSLLHALEHRIDALCHHGPEPTLSALSAHCDTLGTRVRVDGIVGLAERITPEGALIVRTDDARLVEVRAGDVVTDAG